MAKYKLGGKTVRQGEEELFVKALSESFDNKARSYLRGATASFCPRQNFYNSKEWDFKAKNTATAQVFMGIGNGVEEAVCKGLIRENKLLSNNFWLPDMTPKVSGKIDLIYLDSDNELALGEIKTCGELPIKGKAEHVSQSETYAACAGFDKMNLIYFSRSVMDSTGNLLLRIFPIDTTEENMIKALATMVYSDFAIRENWKPEIPIGFHKTTTCLYCPFNSFCWGESEENYKTLSPDQYSESWETALVFGKQLYNERHKRRLQMFESLKKDFQKNGKQKVYRIDIIEKEITRLEGIIEKYAR